MKVTIIPNKLNGTVIVPPSKSAAHRLIISAALADGISEISNVSMSKDIIATIGAMQMLGAEITVSDDVVRVCGIKNIPQEAEINCSESGSTLRFLIPVACALGVKATFMGKGKLPERPITPYLSELTNNGIKFVYNNSMPFSVSGKLSAGKYEIAGNISSQFITGLLFALPLLNGDSEIILTSKLESKPYVDITIGCLHDFGVIIEETDYGYFIKGNQKYKPFSAPVEGDYSQAAFFYAANALGCNIEIKGLNEKSFQGDKKIIEICEEVLYNNTVPASFSADCSDIPDLVPILTVLACFCKGTSEITNVARLRIKESDRLSAISECLNKLGGKVEAFEDRLVIHGVDYLDGGTVESFNDHRITMAMAIAAVKCTGEITINGAESIEKSYPDFFDDYIKLGGKIHGFNLEP